MASSHPYSSLRVPKDAPFELRPSLGKGWGAFAIRQIERGTLILREKPLFIIQKSHEDITDQDVWMAFQRLLPGQKRQFLCLRDNASDQFKSMNKAFAENCFLMDGIEPGNGPPVRGLFLLQSRFNHSCVPNSKVPTTNGDTIASFATRDILVGEEITFCYDSDFECRTRHERHQALRFVCDCKACLLGTPFQQLSDPRRRLIRGLQYLLLGVGLDGQRQVSRSPIITDPELKRASEYFNIPLTSRFIYNLLCALLLEQEELLDDFMNERVTPSIDTAVSFFRTDANATIAKFAMAQETWLEKVDVAFRLFGQADACDHELALLLRQLRGVS
ncbi:hypothetical protein B0T10DRAFT_260423 [Thelonectria olida]|uniref:SET domain-containing protein n=1 Tax=Thelonectria olida TaxID=1576542 RepID=A0A9P8VRG2_9HYPO|nr:hypothetical protein B0T10DRAFT_260423 [Thelonectria olida]